MNFQKLTKAFFGICLLALMVPPVRADVCVWRDPDRTMSKLFPEASDYLTITKKMTPSTVAEIEKKLGAKLDDSEKGEFSFYDLRAMKDGKPYSVGMAIALAGTGEYGVIEVVIGVDPNGVIRSVYIQRSRERANKALRSEKFLGQFIGKSVESPLKFGKDLKNIPESPKDGEVVRLSIKKMLLFWKELLKVPSGEPNQKPGGKK